MFLLFVVSNKVCIHRKRTRECATDTFTAAGIFLGFIISIISHHTFAIFYTMYPRVPIVFTLVLFLLIGCQNGCVRGW